MERHLKKFFIFLLTLALTAGLLGTGTVTAGAKTLKTKKVTLYEDQKKTVRTPKKIRSIYVTDGYECYGYGCYAKKTGAKKFKIVPHSEDDTCYYPTVKDTFLVTYTDGSKQKYQVTVKYRYAEKIIRELRPMLADPDQAMRELAEKYNPGDSVMEDGTVYKRRLARGIKRNEGKGVDAVKENKYFATQTLDEMLAKMTVSQKQAALLQLYFTNQMTYDYKGLEEHDGRKYAKLTFQDIYNGTFTGVCGDGALRIAGICKMLGLEVRVMNSATNGAPHEWACIAAVDRDGTKYWEGIDGTSYACNVIWDYKGFVSEWTAAGLENKIIELDYDPDNCCDIVWDKMYYEVYLYQKGTN